MNNEYSKIMKNLSKKRPSMIVKIVFTLLMVLLVVGSVYGYKTGKDYTLEQKENAEQFSVNNSNLHYYSLTPVFLSEGFATNYDDSINYCLAVDSEYKTYVVAIKADDMNQYQALINYTYQDSGDAPDPITMNGTSVEFDDEMRQLVIEAYNGFWDSDEAKEENFDMVFGASYLDTTQEPQGNYDFMTLCIFLFVVIGIGYTYYYVSMRESLKQTKATLNTYSYHDLWAIDQEINHPTAIAFKRKKLFLTDNYIVSAARGFDVIPLNDIVSCFGCIYEKNGKGAKKSIVLKTKDNLRHEIVVIQSDNNEKIYQEIVDAIKLRLPDIQYGCGDSFYMHLKPNSDLKMHTANSKEETKSNIVLGIIGAILGAALGGALWIIAAKFGRIVGLVGVLMMILSILGYSKFSGLMDLKGLIISILIALFMIFAAEYTYFALSYCEYYLYSNYSIVNILKSYQQLPDFLTATNSWWDLIKDLVIGYLLSVIVGALMFSSAFRSKK